jgi:hypothetical protein
MTTRWNVCSRGHRFQKSSDCPVCPKCWSGYYKKEKQRDFPETLSAPALRALLHGDITSLAQLSHYTESEILALHGMGPSSIPKLRAALKAKGLSFRKK